MIGAIALLVIGLIAGLLFYGHIMDLWANVVTDVAKAHGRINELEAKIRAKLP